MRGDEDAVLYDVQVLSRVPCHVRAQFPDMEVRSLGTRTVLRLGSGDPAVLAGLLDRVRSVGLAITGLHRCGGAAPGAGPGAGPPVRPGAGPAPAYEVWVKDELGDALLWYLRCPHLVVPEQTRVRVALAEGTVHCFVRACADSGATVGRVRRVGGGGLRPPGRTGRGGGGLSPGPKSRAPVNTDPAVGPGVRRPPSG